MKKRLKYVSEYLVALPLLQVALGFAVGIVWGYLGLPIALLMVGCFLLLWFVLLLGDLRFVFAVLVVLISIAGGFYRVDEFAGAEKMQRVGAFYGQSIGSFEIVSVPERGSYNKKVRVVGNGFEGKALVSFPKTAEIHYGDIVAGEFQLEEPEMVEDFDYKEYLKTQGVFYVAKVRKFEVIGHRPGFIEKIALFRESLSERIRKVLPESHASLAAGLVWGERASMPEDFAENLSNTGTTHIIAVSGFNVSVIVLLLLKLAGFIHRKYVIALTAFLLFCFLVLVGFDNLPAMRAGIMGYTVLASKTIGRKSSILSLLSVAVIVLCLINPLSIFTVSFQLSFAATVGLVGLSGYIERFSVLGYRISFGEFSATFAAIVATTPVSVLNFETFSIVALFVNMLVLPVVTFLTFYSAIISIFSFVSIKFAVVLSYPLIILMNYVIGVINFAGGLSFSSVGVGGLASWMVAIMYLVMLSLMIEMSYKSRETGLALD